MAKTIVFCADGTWNGPDDTDQTHDGGDPKLTNVCKLFGWLQGTIDGAWGTKEMELVLGPPAAKPGHAGPLRLRAPRVAQARLAGTGDRAAVVSGRHDGE